MKFENEIRTTEESDIPTLFYFFIVSNNMSYPFIYTATQRKNYLLILKNNSNFLR